MNTRKPNRLKSYDYNTIATYFVTFCTNKHMNTLGTINDTKHILSELGKYVDTALQLSRENLTISKYVIMPNHVHIIITFSEKISLSHVVRSLKSYVSKQAGFPVWQKSFYDHVIRDEKDYLRIWKYIDNNPAKWIEDKYYNEQ